MEDISVCANKPAKRHDSNPFCLPSQIWVGVAKQGVLLVLAKRTRTAKKRY